MRSDRSGPGLLRTSIATLAATLALTGCGSGTGPPDANPAAETSSASQSATAPRPSHDPPGEFASFSDVEMPMEATSGRLTIGGTLKSDLPVTLYRQTAFIAAPDSVQGIDTTTGKLIGRIEPEGVPLDEVQVMGNDNPAQAPTIVKGGGFSVLIAPFVVKVSGTGTTADHVAVELVGVNADTVRAMWRLPIRLPDWADNPYGTVTAAVVGTHESIGVLTVADREQSTSYGIDLASHRVLWTVNDLSAASVADGAVVGIAVEEGEHQRVAGFDVTTGKRIWLGEDSYGLWVKGVGKHLVTASGRTYGDGESYYRFLDARSGEVKHDVPDELSASACDYDDKDTIVCHGRDASSNITYALDATSAKLLWQLPDRQADRIAPVVTAVWHGRIYGNANGRIVALDARSGADLATQPGIAPLLVNESTALALDESGNRLMAYAVVG